MDSQNTPTRVDGPTPPVNNNHDNVSTNPRADNTVPETTLSPIPSATTPSRASLAARQDPDAPTSPVAPDVADIALARVHTIIQYVYTLPVATFEGLNAVEEDLRDALRDVAVGTFPQDVLDELHRAVRERKLGLGTPGVGLEIGNANAATRRHHYRRNALAEREAAAEELAIRRAEAEAARAFDLRGQHLRARLEADQYQRRHETDYEVQMREEWEEDKEEMRAMEGWIKVSLTESGVERVREEIGVEVGEDGIMFVRFGP
ncbi:hypothetical protein LTR35_002999 [Friedmanniomyces endolithicus]|uniref:Uncharacterized protein n=1 Tax=Friedmanniomyces endolithicus TaxID=329885 RepID=A0AAN6J4E6_9PEZI|nr:hypothetical protein LTS00_012354 [Friedmanniomyces endolithicus]KAK0289800.1 hypothetical protein LTR35_002999 [Friedmanniomyces endolithicus]KAK0303852.1 hypothetical protein LTR82_017419 [Friedmanniomyces endolithicus]KAK0975377.1 hypothetical protein LTR54_016825 [Friedmanniomyces endolithicus]